MAAQGVPAVYPTLASALRGTLRERGARGLLAGLGLTLTEIIPYAGLQFGSYEALKAGLLARRGRGEAPLAAWERFGCGLLAGCAAKLALHPLDVAKKRMQVQGLARAASYGASVRAGAYRGAVHCLLSLARAEGAAGLYKGLLPNLLKAAPASGITFVAYEAITAAMKRHDVLCG